MRYIGFAHFWPFRTANN